MKKTKKIIPFILALVFVSSFSTNAFCAVRYNEYKGITYRDSRESLEKLEKILEEDGYEQVKEGTPLYERLVNRDNKYAYHSYLIPENCGKVFLEKSKFDYYLTAPMSEIEEANVILDYYTYDYKADKSNPTGKTNDQIPAGTKAGTLNFTVHVSDEMKEKKASVVLILYEEEGHEYYKIEIPAPDYKREVKIPIGNYSIMEAQLTNTEVLPEAYLNKNFRVYEDGKVTVELSSETALNSGKGTTTSEVVNEKTDEAIEQQKADKKTMLIIISIIIMVVVVLAVVIAVHIIKKKKESLDEGTDS